MFKKQTLKKRVLFFGFLLFSAIAVNSVFAQSTDIEFPTPVTTGEIGGKINARDIGDSRLTTYYYTFNGTQGDIFLKINTSNLNGDIEIFYADNLRPLTKISVYADSPQSETGREIYLRKPEKLILRVEGRTPNDDAATFSIKFSGSFTAAANTDVPEIPTVKSEIETDVRVNSVGTILEIKPKPTPPAKETVARSTAKKTAKPDEPETAESVKNSDAEKSAAKPVVTVTDNLPEKSSKNPPAKRTAAARRRTPAKTRSPVPAKAKDPAKTAANPEKSETVISKTAELNAALERIQLVILFKDGSKIEKPMSEILRVGIDRGMLTVVAKNGSIGRYSILEVVKFTIE